MKRMSLVDAVAVFAVSLSMAACSGNGNNNNGGNDGGADANDLAPLDIDLKVSGTTTIHPQAQAWMVGAGQTVPSIVGLTHRVEEPLKAGLDDPGAVFGTTILDATGAYSVSEVNTGNINLGIAGGIRDERDAGPEQVVRSATTIYDIAIFDAKPETDITGSKTYVLPSAFEAKLTEAVTLGAIAKLNKNEPTDAGPVTQYSLLESGFIFGQVVDAQGNPIAGAKMVASDDTLNKRFAYPSADYATVTSTGTSANGTFLYIGDHKAILPDPFTMSVEGKADYKKRNAGTKPGVAVIVVFYPGTVAPP